MNTELNTKLNTPTPRTDEARRIDNGDTHPLLDEMETMERELSAERAKVRVLRSALERLYADTIYHHDYVDEALAATEDKP